MLEHVKKPLLPRKKFVSRVLRNMLWGFYIVGASLIIGTFGYHYIAGITWIDSFYNASMILTGMGPVSVLTNTAGKLFASFYALFSGIAFLTTIAIVLTPIIHRFVHKFHLDSK
jgi:hypothetical protein